jgi:hypothetical protein
MTNEARKFDDGLEIPASLRRGPTIVVNSSEQPIEPAPNPFDPKRLRISLDFVEGVGVKKAIITIPVKKPNNQDFIRVHPGEDYRLPAAVVELKDDRETFLVTPEIARDIPGEYVTVTLFTCINRQGVLFLWPVRLPSSDGRQLEWHRSAQMAAEMAMKRWCRVKANMSLGAYEVFEASATIPEPEWPDLTLEAMLPIAFKGMLVNSFDHPVLKRLRGEA